MAIKKKRGKENFRMILLLIFTELTNCIVRICSNIVPIYFSDGAIYLMVILLPLPLTIMSKFTLLNIWSEALSAMTAGMKMQFYKAKLINNKWVIYGSISFNLIAESVIIVVYSLNYAGIFAGDFVSVIVIPLAFSLWSLALVVTLYTLKVLLLFLSLSLFCIQ